MPEMQYNGEIKAILERLARIEQKVDDIPKFDLRSCALHGRDIESLTDRIGVMEQQLRSDRKITIVISGFVTAVLIGVKMLFTES